MGTVETSEFVISGLCQWGLSVHSTDGKDVSGKFSFSAILSSKVRVLVASGGRDFRENDAAIKHGVTGDLTAGPDHAVPHHGSRADECAGADDGSLDGRAALDSRLRMDLRGEIQLTMGLEVGAAVAEVEPNSIIKDDGSELAGSCELEKAGDD